MNNKPQEKYLYTPTNKTTDALDIYFCFPGPYSIGMSSLGYLHLFHALDINLITNPIRVFTDHPPKKVKQKSMVGFSFTFELDILNILKTMEKLKIPAFSKDRNEETPLVFAGGPVVTTNPEPFADFFDFIILGDGKTPLLNAVETIYNNQQLIRNQKLLKLSQLDGIYVPKFFDITYHEDFTIEKIIPLAELNKSSVCKMSEIELNECVYSSILTENTVFANTLLVEIQRGCSQKCHFCIASYLNLPVRYPPKESIIAAIKNNLIFTRNIGLLGALITEHPDLNEIFEEIYNLHKAEPIKLTTSSLRADQISPRIAEILAECNQKQITISVEAGSESLRNSLNKKLKNEDLFKCVETCLKYNINIIKMYAMIDLPEETLKDIDDLIKLVKNINNHFKGIQIILSVNSFIPKAHTPFERRGTSKPETNSDKMSYIKKELIKVAKVRTSSAKWDRIQAVLSRGNRQLSNIIYSAYTYGGSLGSFNRAFKEYQQTLPDIEWFANRKFGHSESLPWKHILF